MLDNITPVILTFNEAPNIKRTLGQLTWARDIVVVDSGSTDKTATIITEFPQVRLYHRPFDTHVNQWNYAVHETNVQTDWVLALDADYILTDTFKRELASLNPDAQIDGYTARFTYCVDGKPLHGTLYPPVTVLYRQENSLYVQDGHTQRLVVDGRMQFFSERLLHDDRKPLSHWLAAQDRYMQLEAANIITNSWSELSFSDRVRCFPLIAPFAVFVSCYILKRGFLDGREGLIYALQRMLAEALLGIRILEGRPNGSSLANETDNESWRFKNRA